MGLGGSRASSASKFRGSKFLARPPEGPPKDLQGLKDHNFEGPAKLPGPEYLGVLGLLGPLPFHSLRVKASQAQVPSPVRTPKQPTPRSDSSFRILLRGLPEPPGCP